MGDYRCGVAGVHMRSVQNLHILNPSSRHYPERRIRGELKLTEAVAKPRTSLDTAEDEREDTPQRVPKLPENLSNHSAACRYIQVQREGRLSVLSCFLYFTITRAG